MVFEYLGIISIFNLLILSLFLFIKKTKHKSRFNLLASITFIIAYTQFVFILFLNGRIANYPFLSYTDSISISAILPLFYIYLKLVFYNKPIFAIENVKHLIPIVPGLFYWIYFLLLPIELQNISLKNKSCGNIPDIYLYFISAIFQLSYCLLSLRKLNDFYFSNKSRLSASDSKEITWHFVLVYGFFILSTAFITIYIIVSNEHIIDKVSTIILDLLFIFILIFLINRPSNYSLELENIESHIKELKQQQKAVLPVEKNNSLVLQIEKEIKLKKIYLENTNLSKISKALGIPEYKISQAINQEYKMSVPDFINFLRVELAKEILVREDYIKIDFLAKECGFNTRASFYNAFKKFTNTTPNNYKGSLK